MKFLFNKQNLSLEEKKERRKSRLLLILTGILFGISFTPFPFPFPLFLFIAFVPYFFVITKKQTLLKVNSSSYLTFFVMSLVTVYWVGSWQSESDPFLNVKWNCFSFLFAMCNVNKLNFIFSIQKSF